MKLCSPYEKHASTPKQEDMAVPPNDVQGQPLGQQLKHVKQGHRKAAWSWYSKRQALDGC